MARLLKDAGGIPAHGNQRTEWMLVAASTSFTDYWGEPAVTPEWAPLEDQPARYAR